MSPLNIGLYAGMVITGILSFWASRQFRNKGAAWGRPAAVLFGVMTLTLVAVKIYLTLNPITPDYSNTEAQYQYVGYKFLGQEIAKRNPGAKILIIKPPSVVSEKAQLVRDKQELGLKDGLAGKATILAEVELASGMDPQSPEAMGYVPGGGLTAEKFDEYIEDHMDCTVVLSMVGMPPDLQEMELWKKIEDKEDVPKLALVGANVYPLKPLFQADVISVALHNKPARFDPNADVPEDEQAAFDTRFILITKDSVDELSKTYPNLFRNEKK